MGAFVTPTQEELQQAQALYSDFTYPKISEVDPQLMKLVMELTGTLADKWTMLVLGTLEDHGALRFGQLNSLIDGISQKMLTKTIRQMERNGLLVRTVYPVIPPKVEYRLTKIGIDLANAFCTVWLWAAMNHQEVEDARKRFQDGETPTD